MNFPFDPTYGYDLERLLQIESPEIPHDFENFWRTCLERISAIRPRYSINEQSTHHPDWDIFDTTFESSDEMPIGGWLLVPRNRRPRRGFVVCHGYGGRDAPDFHLPFTDSAILFPCCRGLPTRSMRAHISTNPQWHVLHDIDQRDRYIHRGCVEDVWLSVSLLLRLFPELDGHLGFLGTSFGGGIGAIAMAFDTRVQAVHLCVPSFGNHPLRLQCPTRGSGASVTTFYKKNPWVLERTLRYFDAATAAKFIKIPTHCACALLDPFVAPPGQFSIFNAIKASKELFVLKAGHHQYPGMQEEEERLLAELEGFFARLLNNPGHES